MSDLPLDEIVGMLERRDGENFDGEVHLTSGEAKRLSTLLRSLSAENARLTKERDELRKEAGELVVAQYAISAAEARIADLEALIAAQHGDVVSRTAKLLYEKDDKIALLTTRAESTDAALRDALELAERLKVETQGHASEARTANSTIYEVYQVLSGGRGQLGNWNSAEPARQFVAQVQEVLAPFLNVRDQFPESAKLINKNMGEFAPISVTVTKGQFLDARQFLEIHGSRE